MTKSKIGSGYRSVLVTGGAGYIGSHIVWRLIEAGYPVVVLDNLYSGHRWAAHQDAEFIEGDAGDAALIRSILHEHKVGAVIHLAGHIVVPESVAEPLRYYRSNTCISRDLIEACLEAGVNNFVYSSSASVYGNPEQVPVGEDSATIPASPYGSSKLMTEWILRDVAAAQETVGQPFRYIALRYFNVAGARADGRLGQATPTATHLIKVACEAACGLRDHVAIFGTDYDTPDGTCIRDYIHVEDLATAHLAALSYLDNGGTSQALNCGYGRGYSVREVLDMVRKVSGTDFDIREAARRPGDIAALIADPTRLQRMMDWQPRHANLETICRSAFEWEKAYQQRRANASMAGY